MPRRRTRSRRIKVWLRDRRQLVRWTLLTGGGLIALGLVWIAITAFLARQQTQELKHRLIQVRALVASGQVEQAQSLAKDVPAIAERAHDLTTGPAWWVAAHIPLLGAPLDVARGTTSAGAQVGMTAVPKLMSVARALDPGHLRSAGDTITLRPLVAALPELREAADAINGASNLLADLPRSTWIGAVDRGLVNFGADLAVVRNYVDSAVRVAEVLPTMLGDERPHTYFIGLQNEAELRGTGGLPGAFAIARTDRGNIKFTRFESNAALEPPGKDHAIQTGLSFGRDYDSAYGPSLPTTTFVDSNASPHFPYAAKIWAAMWKKISGQQVDGVLALDPTALAYFLTATGPTTLSGGGALTAKNVVSLTQRDQYTLFPDNIERKQFVVTVLQAAAKKVTSGAGGGVTLLQAATRSASEHRLLAWSREPRVQQVLERSDYAGAIPATDRPFAALILNNAAAGKLDFYLTRSFTYTRTGCGPTRDVLVTIALTNSAPASGLPLYVAGRLDARPASAKPGDNHALVDFYATTGAVLQSVTLNGAPSTAALEHGLGHPIFRLSLELPRGTTQTVVLHLREPASAGTPQIWRQPGVTPLDVQSATQPCG